MTSPFIEPASKLDNLVAIITVAEKRDVELAAAELGLSASAVRKQIETVDGILGASLFEGRKGNLAATPLQAGTRIKLVVQAQSQPDNIATLPLLTATFVRPVRPVARGTATETLAA